MLNTNRLASGIGGFLARYNLFLDPCCFPFSAAQVIELCAAYRAEPFYLDFGDERAVVREDPLDAYPTAPDLSNCERGVCAVGMPGDNDSAENLYSLLLALDDPIENVDVIPGVELRELGFSGGLDYFFPAFHGSLLSCIFKRSGRRCFVISRDIA